MEGIVWECLVSHHCVVLTPKYGLGPVGSCINRDPLFWEHGGEQIVFLKCSWMLVVCSWRKHFLVFKIWARDYCLARNVNGSDVYCTQTGGLKKQVCLLWFLLMSLLPQRMEPWDTRWKEPGSLTHHGAHSSMRMGLLCDWEMNFYRLKPQKCWTVLETVGCMRKTNYRDLICILKGLLLAQ